MGSTGMAADVNLRIMQTTDLHMHAMNFDYYRNSEVNDFGLARTATLIRDARSEARNSLLFDNGDLIQGNPMGDYMARSRGLSYGEVHPLYKAMNLLGYDAANIGNQRIINPLLAEPHLDLDWALTSIDPRSDKCLGEPGITLQT